MKILDALYDPLAKVLLILAALSLLFILLSSLAWIFDNHRPRNSFRTLRRLAAAEAAAVARHRANRRSDEHA